MFGRKKDSDAEARRAQLLRAERADLQRCETQLRKARSRKHRYPDRAADKSEQGILRQNIATAKHNIRALER